MKLLDIQSMLARDYTLTKWDLVETMEQECRQLRSLCLHQGCRDIVSSLYDQEIGKVNAVKLAQPVLTFKDVIAQLGLVSPANDAVDLIELYQQDIAAFVFTLT